MADRILEVLEVSAQDVAYLEDCSSTLCCRADIMSVKVLIKALVLEFSHMSSCMGSFWSSSTEVGQILHLVLILIQVR